MAKLNDIPVATASTPMAAKPSVLGDVAQAAGLALQVGEVAAAAYGKGQADKKMEELLSDAEAAISVEEGKAASVMTERAKRLKSKFDQGLLTNAALQVELEKELRDVSSTFGGLYSDVIYRAATQQLGVDPRGSRLSHIVEQVRAAEDTSSGLSDMFSKEDVQQIMGRMQVLGITQEESVNVQLKQAHQDNELERAITMIESSNTIGKKRGEQLKVIYDIQGEQFRLEQLQILQSLVNEGRTIRGEDFPEYINTKRLELRERMKELTQLAGKPVDSFALKAMDEVIDAQLTDLQSIFEAMDTLDRDQDKLAAAKNASAMMLHREEPFLFALINSDIPREAIAHYLVNPEAAKTMIPVLGRFASKYQTSPMELLSYAAAVSNGDVKQQSDILKSNPGVKSALEGFAEDSGISTGEAANSIIKKSSDDYNMRNNATPEAKIGILSSTANDSIHDTLLMLEDPAYFNGIANNSQVASIYNEVFNRKVSQLSTGVATKPLEIPTAYLGATLGAGSAASQAQARRAGHRLTQETTLLDLMVSGHIELEVVDRGSRVEVQPVFSENFEDNIMRGNQHALARIEKVVEDTVGREMGALATVLRKAERNGLKMLLNNAEIPSYKELPKVLSLGMIADVTAEPEKPSPVVPKQVGETVEMHGLPVTRMEE